MDEMKNLWDQRVTVVRMMLVRTDTKLSGDMHILIYVDEICICNASSP